MTSSAVASSVGGTVRPSILAVWALMTRSKPQATPLVGALEDAAGICAELTIRIHNVGSGAHQPADFSKVAVRECRGDRVRDARLTN
jgi:hypothetical protein